MKSIVGRERLNASNTARPMRAPREGSKVQDAAMPSTFCRVGSLIGGRVGRGAWRSGQHQRLRWHRAERIDELRMKGCVGHSIPGWNDEVFGQWLRGDNPQGGLQNLESYPAFRRRVLLLDGPLHRPVLQRLDTLDR